MDSWKTKYLFPALGMIPIDRAGGDASAARRSTRPSGVLRARRAVRHLPRGHPQPRRRAAQGPHRRRPAGAEHRLPDLPGRRDRHRRDPAARREGARSCSSRARSASAGRSTSSRYQDRADDRLVLRQITDEVMFEIRELTGQEYVDVYADEEGRDAADRRRARSRSVADEHGPTRAERRPRPRRLTRIAPGGMPGPPVGSSVAYG